MAQEYKLPYTGDKILELLAKIDGDSSSSSSSTSSLQYAQITLQAATLDSANPEYNTIGEWVEFGKWKFATMWNCTVLVKVRYNDDFVNIMSFETNGWETTNVYDQSASGFNKLPVVIARTDDEECDCFGDYADHGKIVGDFVITENNANLSGVTVGSSYVTFSGDCVIIGAQTSSGYSSTGTVYYGLGLGVNSGGIAQTTAGSTYQYAYAHCITTISPNNSYPASNGIKCTLGGGRRIEAVFDVLWGIPSKFEAYPATATAASYSLRSGSVGYQRNTRTEEQAREEGFFDRI